MTVTTGPDMRWWENPLRPCRDRPEYSDTTLVTGEGRAAALREMSRACHFCPVLTECRTEILTIGGKPPVTQVRAGIVFK